LLGADLFWALLLKFLRGRLSLTRRRDGVYKARIVMLGALYVS